MYFFWVYSWSSQGRACSISSTPKTSTRWRNSWRHGSPTLANGLLMLHVSLLPCQVSETNRADNVTYNKRYMSLSFCVQLGFRSRQKPPSGHPTWPLEPGDPSSAGWSRVGSQGSKKTDTHCPVLPKRKVGWDSYLSPNHEGWPPPFQQL